MKPSLNTLLKILQKIKNKKSIDTIRINNLEILLNEIHHRIRTYLNEIIFKIIQETFIIYHDANHKELTCFYIQTI